MMEVELKSVLPHLEDARRRLDAAGARPVFAGRLEDRRYDLPDGRLAAGDEVLRLRVYRDESGVTGSLDWKGPASVDDGYKVREEISLQVGDPDALAIVLGKLGYRLTMAIDRSIRQYEIHGATVRLERYPRMDDLIEVEGPPDAIERAIAATGLPRAGFTAERLPDFVRRYEERSGARAALSDAEAAGSLRYDVANA